MVENKHSFKIGGIYSCIAGDARYGTIIEVKYDTRDGSVSVERLENGACGGMDGNGSSYPWETRQHVTVSKPTGSAIVKAIKMVMDDTVKRYGKPTKNFTFYVSNDGLRRDVKGLNAKLAQKALDDAIVCWAWATQEHPAGAGA